MRKGFIQPAVAAGVALGEKLQEKIGTKPSPEAEERARKQAELRWFVEATPEQINERVLESYIGLGEGIDRYTDGLSEEEVVGHFGKIKEAEESGEHPTISNVIDETAIPEIGIYKDTMALAYKRLLDDGMEGGDFMPLIALIRTYEEPFYARNFLALLSGSAQLLVLTNGGAKLSKEHLNLLNPLISVKKMAVREGNAKVRQEFHFSKSSVFSALKTWLSLSGRRQKKRIAEEEELIKSSLEEITDYPSVPVQLLKRSLAAKPLAGQLD